MFVVVSCGCCFLQSCIAFVILLPILYSQKCSVTFLKMQFCTATSTAMAIFTLGLLKLLPQVNIHHLLHSNIINFKTKCIRETILCASIHNLMFLVPFSTVNMYVGIKSTFLSISDFQKKCNGSNYT